MNHPSRDTWMSYLYGELSPADRDAAAAHLAACDACRDSVRRWQNTMALLDQDQATLITRRRPARAGWKSALPWAAAAAVLLAFGFWVGRASGPSRVDLERELAAAEQRIQTEIGIRFREDFQRLAGETVRAGAEENRKWITALAQTLQNTRAEDRQWLIQTLETLEERRVLDSERLREGLVRLAENTGSGFRQAESQVALLASYLPASISIPENTNPTTP